MGGRSYILYSLDKKKGKERVPISEKQRYRVLKRNGHRCRSCGRGPKDGVKLQIDHKIPVDWKGKEFYANGDLQTYCEECNRGKKNWYADFNKDEVQDILSLRSGTAKIEALFRSRKNRPIPWEILDTLSGIRDWPRTLRILRQTKKMNIVWDREKKTYTFRE